LVAQISAASLHPAQNNLGVFVQRAREGIASVELTVAGWRSCYPTVEQEIDVCMVMLSLRCVAVAEKLRVSAVEGHKSLGASESLTPVFE